MPSPTLIVGGKADRLWRRLAELPDASAETATDAAVVQISVPPAATVGLIRQLLQLDADGTIQAHGGNGVIRGRFSPGKAERGEMANSNLLMVLCKQLRPMVAAAGGHMVVLSYPQRVELDCRDVWGPASDGAAVMQAIKDRFDPKGILNPDRFVYDSR